MFRDWTSICTKNIIISCKMFSENQNLVLEGSEAEPVSTGGISSAVKCSLKKLNLVL
jgi:hypothetical protein